MKVTKLHLVKYTLNAHLSICCVSYPGLQWLYLCCSYSVSKDWLAFFFMAVANTVTSTKIKLLCLP